MGITNKLLVTEGDTVKEIQIKPGDLVAFERKYNLSYGDLYEEVVDEETGKVTERPSRRLRMEHTYFMAWNALRRTAQLDPPDQTFDAFLDSVDDIADPDVADGPLESSGS